MQLQLHLQPHWQPHATTATIATVAAQVVCPFCMEVNQDVLSVLVLLFSYIGHSVFYTNTSGMLGSQCMFDDTNSRAWIGGARLGFRLEAKANNNHVDCMIEQKH